MPALVRVLAGNPVTSTTIFACLNTVDAAPLRRLHPAVAGAVAGVPWCDMGTAVVDIVRWRAGLSAAVGMRLAQSTEVVALMSEPAASALRGITHLDLRNCTFVTDELLIRLPTSLRSLNVHSCNALTPNASFAHLTTLAVLDCSETRVVSKWTVGLSRSLQELDITQAPVTTDGVSLAHLSQLRVLRAAWSWLDTFMLASLPLSLLELHAPGCSRLTPATSFAHLTALRILDMAHSAIGDASLASVSPTLVFLNARGCKNLTAAAALPPLPALRLLDVSDAGIGDALVASLPASLIELRLAGCRSVTTSATLHHVHALRLLHCIGTELAPTTLADCRTRGCAVRTASMLLRGHDNFVASLELLDDGQLASGDLGGEMWLWDVAVAGGEAPAVLEGGNALYAMAALQDGRRLAAGTASWNGNEAGIEVWDVRSVPPARHATINCFPGVWALAAMAGGRLAAGCDDGAVRIVDVDAGTVVATLAGHVGKVKALAVLPGGALASGSDDAGVRVWDVAARACVATLRGHTGQVTSLEVLADGRLASGAGDGTVWLWDVGSHTCVGMLTACTGTVAALAALPDGRLAAGFSDGTIQLWDTRPAATAAAAGTSRAASAVPVEVVSVLSGSVGALASLPDGRLACGSGSATNGMLCLLELPPPAVYD